MRDTSAANVRLDHASHVAPAVSLDGVAHGGTALGHLGELVAFVAYGLPGEHVTVDVLERKARFVRGRVGTVLDASPDRVAPVCPIFGKCGGCHWQHASYAAQLKLKTAVLREQLERGGRFVDPPLAPALASPREWHYRNTIQTVPGERTPDGAVLPTGGADHRRSPSGARLLCFKEWHSDALTGVDHCYISEPLVNRAIDARPWEALPEDVWQRLQGVVLRVVPEQALQITLVAPHRLDRAAVQRFADAARARLPELAGVVEMASRGGPEHAVWGDGALRYELAGSRLTVPAEAFFQVNRGAAERLVDLAVAWLDPAAGDVILDAYAGVGTFALALARRAGSVMAVESHPAAALAASQNAAANGVSNVLVQSQPVEAALPRLNRSIDLALLDPPRGGCSPVALEGLATLAPRKIVYVSCEPSTLARDLRRLAAAGYRLTRAAVVDLFPQTFHVESVSLLERM